jgi:hypothetical protein
MRQEFNKYNLSAQFISMKYVTLEKKYPCRDMEFGSYIENCVTASWMEKIPTGETEV